MERKPIKLKSVLLANGIAQSRWCIAVKQFDGRSISDTMGNRIINWLDWPTKTKEHSVKKQTEDFLREQGVPDDEIAVIWEPEENVVGIFKRHPTGTRSLSESERARAREANQFNSPEPEMLTQAARQLFEISRDPFHDDVDNDKDVYKSNDLLHVRQAMFMTAKLGGILAVIGESGSGKTTLRRDLLDRIERENLPVRVIMPRAIDKERLTAAHICEAIVQELSPGSTMGRSIEGKARQAEKLLSESRSAGNQHVIVIEEAHDLTNKMLGLLKRFWELEKGFKKLLSIVLVGQPELGRRLDARANPDIREFINRCEQVRIQPLDRTNLEAYLLLKFLRVGVKLSQVFDGGALDGIIARLTVQKGGNKTESQVYPLLVNNLVTKAMNACADVGAPKVSAAVVKDL